MTADIARLVLELGQNAIEAGAARVVICLEQTPAGARTVQVLDDGPGFNPTALCRGTGEGFTTAARPGAGRGLALARRTAQRLCLSNAPDGGALVRAWLSPAKARMRLMRVLLSSKAIWPKMQPARPLPWKWKRPPAQPGSCWNRAKHPKNCSACAGRWMPRWQPLYYEQRSSAYEKLGRT